MAPLDYPLALPEEIADSALCAQTDPEIFFSDRLGEIIQAKKICAQCPVREACLEWSVETGQRFGVWGGLSKGPRKKLIHERHKNDHRVTPEQMEEIRDSGMSSRQVAKAYGISQTRACEVLRELAA